MLLRFTWSDDCQVDQIRNATRVIGHRERHLLTSPNVVGSNIFKRGSRRPPGHSTPLSCMNLTVDVSFWYHGPIKHWTVASLIMGHFLEVFPSIFFLDFHHSIPQNLSWIYRVPLISSCCGSWPQEQAVLTRHVYLIGKFRAPYVEI